MTLRHNGLALALTASLAFFSLAGLASPALACGELEGWVDKYNDPEATDKTRQAALRELSGPCSGYIAVTSDFPILEVLHDALRRKYDKTQIQAVFMRYRCIPGAAGETIYAQLTDALDTAACPTAVDRQTWHVVAVSGAFLRARASKSSKRVGFVKHGMIVEKQGQSGDWMKVRTWRNQTGFIHGSLLAIY